MPFLLLGLIVLTAFIHSLIPLEIKSALYAISLTLKSVIIFVLPFLIFGLLFKTAAQLSKKASKTILILMGAIIVSNFASTLLSYGVGSLAYRFDLAMHFPEESALLQPAWTLAFPKLIGNDVALFSGLILGVLFGRFKPQWAEKLSFYSEKGISFILKAFLFIVPLFLLGFVVKMYHDKVMTHILSNYALIFSVIALAVFTYIAFIYLVAARFQKGPFTKSLKNMLPAAIAGFGSMSSAAAMPLTILGTEKNAHNPQVARSLIPATVNIHLIGDCFAIPIFAFAVLKSFGLAEPTFVAYLTFAAYFVLAKFSVAAVPGGGILVMLPILENTLHFDAGMLSLITALYILFDPVITAANVLGNGGFALAIDRVMKKRAPTLFDTN